MNKTHIVVLRIISAIMLFPYITGFDADSTGTDGLTITIGAGKGLLSSRGSGCNESLNPVSDAGAGIELKHKTLIIGVKAGTVDYDEGYTFHDYENDTDSVIVSAKNVFYSNPYIGISDSFIDLRIGAVLHNLAGNGGQFFSNGGSPPLSLFIGIILGKSMKVSYSALNGLPLFSSGGRHEGGIEYNIGDSFRHSIWGGVVWLDNKNVLFGLRYKVPVIFGSTVAFGCNIGMTPFSSSEKGRMSHLLSMVFSTPLWF